jgi:hypothetical protein
LNRVGHLCAIPARRPLPCRRFVQAEFF